MAYAALLGVYVVAGSALVWGFRLTPPKGPLNAAGCFLAFGGFVVAVAAVVSQITPLAFGDPRGPFSFLLGAALGVGIMVGAYRAFRGRGGWREAVGWTVILFGFLFMGLCLLAIPLSMMPPMM